MEHTRLIANVMTGQRVELQMALQSGRCMGCAWNTVVKEGSKNKKNRKTVKGREECVGVTNKLVAAGLLGTAEEEIEEWKVIAKKVEEKTNSGDIGKTEEVKLKAAIIETHAIAKDIHAHMGLGTEEGVQRPQGAMGENKAKNREEKIIMRSRRQSRMREKEREEKKLDEAARSYASTATASAATTEKRCNPAPLAKVDNTVAVGPSAIRTAEDSPIPLVSLRTEYEGRRRHAW